jgi:hypothetical protein
LLTRILLNQMAILRKLSPQDKISGDDSEMVQTNG